MLGLSLSVQKNVTAITILNTVQVLVALNHHAVASTPPLLQISTRFCNTFPLILPVFLSRRLAALSCAKECKARLGHRDDMNIMGGLRGPCLLDEDLSQARLAEGVVLQVEAVKAVERVLVCVHVQRVHIQVIPAHHTSASFSAITHHQTFSVLGRLRVVLPIILCTLLLWKVEYFVDATTKALLCAEDGKAWT